MACLTDAAVIDDARVRHGHSLAPSLIAPGSWIVAQNARGVVIYRWVPTVPSVAVAALEEIPQQLLHVRTKQTLWSGIMMA